MINGIDFSLLPNEVFENVVDKYNLPVVVRVEIGNKTMLIKDLLKLKKGVILQLKQKIDDPVKVYINECMVARGELVVENNRLSVILTEIIESNRWK